MNALNLMGAVAVLCWTSLALNAQQNNGDFLSKEAPRDNFYDRYMHTEKRVLAYDYIHEKDVFWEKRVWREIDTRVKQNHHFIYPKASLAEILLTAARENKVTAYSNWSDDFKRPLSCKEVNEICVDTDTIITFDIVTGDEIVQVVHSEVDLTDIKKYRIKESWFFDEETGNMEVRILGIAPIIDRYDISGNFLNSGPMFWFYYPDLRKVLATKEAFNDANDAMRMSWDDVFEARFFDSNITKASNIHDARLQDQFAGIDILLAADKVKSELFNFEHDLWEY